MISDKQFQQAAALLKRSSEPDAWSNFMGAFQAYTFTRIGEVADADMQNVVLAQGGARHCKKLLQLLDECEQATKPQGGTAS